MENRHFVLSARRSGFVLCRFCLPAFAQTDSDPEKLIEQAERLSWVKAWARAAPLYAEAERLYAARGDRRNALYAQINYLRGQLPRLPVP